nr:hypothetical protein Iba_chr13fCG4100 [Ipomoea batatas]
MVGDGLRSGLRFAAGDGWLVDSDLEAMDDDGWPADSDLKAMDGSVSSAALFAATYCLALSSSIETRSARASSGFKLGSTLNSKP